MGAIVEQSHPNPSARAAPSIVHPTDFSPANAQALAYAVAIALRTHARLTLLHIRSADDAAPTRHGLTQVGDLLVRWRRLEPTARFSDFSQRLGFSATCLDVPARSVSEGVLSHFAEHPVELAVLSTASHTGLGFWFAGSVSRQALRRANTMILFLREGQKSFVDVKTGEWRLRRVLIPIDGRMPVAPALARTLALIARFGAPVELRLLHVGDAPPHGLPADVPLTLAQGPVPAAILAVAGAFHADLIAMPTAGKRGLLAAFRNSVSAHILDDARWPVLSVPALAPDAAGF